MMPREQRIGFIGFLLVLASIVTAPQAAQAVILNGGFETGDFTGWTTTGTTSIETAAFGSGPTEGTSQALLSTVGTAATDSDLETFLGLAAGSLDGLGNGDAIEGAAIKQTFSASAGDLLSFDWNFLTNESTPSTFNDFAFVTINPTSELADTGFATFFSSPTPFDEETGFSTFSFPIAATDSYTLGIGVVDEGDVVISSGLLIDRVSLTSSNGTVIPEPTSMLLFGLGSLSALGARNRRIRKVS
jgi:hypothetical protein